MLNGLMRKLNEVKGCFKKKNKNNKSGDLVGTYKYAKIKEKLNNYENEKEKQLFTLP
jgi:hypothetical protein